MKVLLVKDVYKLGHAGDVKKVADGFGRNFLLPQGLAVLATAGALTTIEKIKAKAAVTRAVLNNEMSGLAEQVEGVELFFTSKAGETGKLYGSITSQMIIDALNLKLGSQIDRHQVEAEPIRNLGEHFATIRLTIDLNPKVKVTVTREGEETAKPAIKAKKAVEPDVEAPKVTEVGIDEVKTDSPVEPVIKKTKAIKPEIEEQKTDSPVEPVVKKTKAIKPEIEEQKTDSPVKPAVKKIKAVEPELEDAKTDSSVEREAE
jgi:large subunit ribosomal protein L9